MGIEPTLSSWEAVRVPPVICGFPRRTECSPNGGRSSDICKGIGGAPATSGSWEAARLPLAICGTEARRFASLKSML